MIQKNDVVQITKNHRWVGCFGYVTRADRYENGSMRYMIGVPVPEKGTAYTFDDGSGVEKVGTAVLIPAESKDGER